MNPAHNSYNGPETQYTKFTHHREMVGLRSRWCQGLDWAESQDKVAEALTKRQARKACSTLLAQWQPRPPPGLKFRGERPTLVPDKHSCILKSQPSSCSQLWPLWRGLISLETSSPMFSLLEPLGYSQNNPSFLRTLGEEDTGTPPQLQAK